MGRGKQKGNTFERKICDQLSEWWSGKKNKRIFWRSASSGGMATQRAKKGLKTQGQGSDVTNIHPSGKYLIKLFTIELKRGYNKHTLYDLLDKTKKHKDQEWEKWFRQAHEGAINGKTMGWMVINQRDRRRAFVFYSFSLYQKFFNDLVGLRVPRLHVDIKIRLSDGSIKELCIMGCPLDAFLKAVKPEHIKRIYNENKVYRLHQKELRLEAKKKKRAEERKVKGLSKTRKKKGKAG